jgi:hypothetical protein
MNKFIILFIVIFNGVVSHASVFRTSSLDLYNLEQHLKQHLEQHNDFKLSLVNNKQDLSKDISAKDSANTIAIPSKTRLELAREKQDKFFWSSSLIFPGAGQFYNKKFWKLPIVYLGFALITWSWNHHDNNLSKYVSLYKTHGTQNYAELCKDSRKWRTFSLVCGLFWYGLVASDAYVDSELSKFNVDNLD